MGTTCSVAPKNNNSTVSPTNQCNMKPKSSMLRDQKPSQSQFKFVLNDAEILISPPPLFSGKYKSPSSNTTTVFLFKGIDTDENKNEIVKALEIPMIQLCNTPINLEFHSSQDYHKMAENNSQTTPQQHFVFNPQTLAVSISLPKRKPNLYRSNDAASWDSSDTEELHKELKQRLCFLRGCNVACKGIKHDKRRSSLYVQHTFTWDDSEDFPVGRDDNVVYILSSDWISEDTESEETQMQKHLDYLKNENENHTDNPIANKS